MVASRGWEKKAPSTRRLTTNTFNPTKTFCLRIGGPVPDQGLDIEQLPLSPLKYTNHHDGGKAVDSGSADVVGVRPMSPLRLPTYISLEVMVLLNAQLLVMSVE